MQQLYNTLVIYYTNSFLLSNSYCPYVQGNISKQAAFKQFYVHAWVTPSVYGSHQEQQFLNNNNNLVNPASIQHSMKNFLKSNFMTHKRCLVPIYRHSKWFVEIFYCSGARPPRFVPLRLYITIRPSQFYLAHALSGWGAFFTRLTPDADVMPPRFPFHGYF